MNKKLKEKLVSLLPEGFSAEAITEIVQFVDSQVKEEVKVFKDKLSNQVSVYLKEQYETLCESAKANAKSEAEKALQTITTAIAPLLGESVHLNEATAEKTRVLSEQVTEMKEVILEAKQAIQEISAENKTLLRENQSLKKQVKESAKALSKNFSGKAVIVAQNLKENVNDDDGSDDNFFLSEEVMSFHKNLD